MANASRKPFGRQFLLTVLVGIPLSFSYLLLIGADPVLDTVLSFPLLLLPWPNDPAVKLVVLVNAAIWGFGLTSIIPLLCIRVAGLVRRSRHYSSP